MAGVPLRTVGELLGHRSPAMTWRYSHLAPSHRLPMLIGIIALTIAVAFLILMIVSSHAK
jgi:hypothetical protein